MNRKLVVFSIVILLFACAVNPQQKEVENSSQPEKAQHSTENILDEQTDIAVQERKQEEDVSQISADNIEEDPFFEIKYFMSSSPSMTKVLSKKGIPQKQPQATKNYTLWEYKSSQGMERYYFQEGSFLKAEFESKDPSELYVFPSQ